jgi:hypothetical protein
MMLPRMRPIIPVAVKQPFDDPEWVFEFSTISFPSLVARVVAFSPVEHRIPEKVQTFDENLYLS